MNSISIASRRRKLATIEQANPNARIIDVTSLTSQPWVRFSPFFPHGNIPIPNTDKITAQSVEGVWQALKVFENEGVDRSKLDITNMKGIKRSVRTRGKVLGHQFGLDSDELLDYLSARIKIYLPTYRYILTNRVTREVSLLREMLEAQPDVLLDYETNTTVTNLRKPLSHAGLVVAYLTETWPSSNEA